MEYTSLSQTIDSMRVMTLSDIWPFMWNRKRHDPVSTQRVLDLEIGRAHFDVRLSIVRTGDHASIVVTENYDGGVG